MRNKHAAVAIAAAFLCHDLYNSLGASEANASEYLCNMRDLHAAATAAASGRISSFISVWEDVSESASFFLLGLGLLELSYSVHEDILEKFLRILWARGR